MMGLVAKRSFASLLTTFLVMAFLCQIPRAQTGRVIINEYMVNPNNTCPQFIEILNLGPGPQNIGCYVIATNINAITIPANTTLLPGKIYVISGENAISDACNENINGITTVNLNWNSCNGCVSGPALTGGNFMESNISSTSYPLVLYDKDGKVLDAVRNTTNSNATTTNITTATISGCTSILVNTGNASITYESYIPKPGNQNSITRVSNGACIWQKTPHITPGADNAYDTTAQFNVTSSYTSICGGAAASFTFNNISGTTVFPLTYILGYDPNPTGTVGDGNNDTYTTGSSSGLPTGSPTYFTIPGLTAGNYSILIEPYTGCNQVKIDFYIPYGTYTNTTVTTQAACTAGQGTATTTFNFGLSTEIFPLTYTLTTASGTSTGTTSGTTVNGLPAFVINNLASGTYTMTYKAKEACATATTSFFIPIGTYSSTITTTAVCSGEKATIKFLTGISSELFPMTYSYTGPSGTVTGTVTTGTTSGGYPAAELTGLTSGNYTITYTPYRACSSTTTNFTVYTGTYSYSISTDPSCSVNSGSATIKFTNGTSGEIFPMNYTLTSASGSATYSATATTADGLPAFKITGLAAGTYTLSFTPRLSCSQVNTSFTVYTGRPSVNKYIQYASGCLTANVTFNFEQTAVDQVVPLTYTLTSIGTSTQTVVTNAIIVNTWPAFRIYDLPVGTYSITFSPYKSCETTTASIILTQQECRTVEERLKKFTGKNAGAFNEFYIDIQADGVLKVLELQSSQDGKIFNKAGDVPFDNRMGLQSIVYSSPAGNNAFFRLSLTDIYSKNYLSPVVRIVGSLGTLSVNVSPNPLDDYIDLTYVSKVEEKLYVSMISSTGSIIRKESFQLKLGQNNFRIPTGNLSSGQYFIYFRKSSSADMQTTKLIKK